jgi:hypothetical protein
MSGGSWQCGEIACNGSRSGRSADEGGAAALDPFQKAGLSGYDALF